MQTVVVLDVLSQLLSDKNLESFSSLQEFGLGSQAALNVTEKYGSYIGSAINIGNIDAIFQPEENLCELLCCCWVLCYASFFVCLFFPVFQSEKINIDQLPLYMDHLSVNFSKTNSFDSSEFSISIPRKLFQENTGEKFWMFSTDH